MSLYLSLAPCNTFFTQKHHILLSRQDYTIASQNTKYSSVNSLSHRCSEHIILTHNYISNRRSVNKLKRSGRFGGWGRNITKIKLQKQRKTKGELELQSQEGCQRFFSKVHYKGPLLLNFKDGIKHVYLGRKASQYRKGNHGGLGLLPNNP